MFLASLNLDLFFKKVFSNKKVTKKFLEDLLGVTITEIKFLANENKLTDDAAFVKFDFRCKIRGKYVIVEMQQQYKIDVVKRFFLYHSVSTTLQLETLKLIKLTKPSGETYTEKNYSGLEPVITLIWMVDDTLGFDDDLVVFSTLPEAATDFIKDDDLWEKPIEDILTSRKKVLKMLENKTKGLDFISQNKLIYIFQKNIVKNKREGLSYFKWFDFANKSRNPNNTEEDFTKYKKDKDMAEVIKRLRKDKLSPEEFRYVSDAPMFELFWERMRQEHDTELKRRNKLEAAQSLKLEKAEAEREKAEAEREKAEAEREKAEVEREKAEAERVKAEAEKVKAEAEKVKAEAERERAEAERERAEAEKVKAEAEKVKAEAEKEMEASRAESFEDIFLEQIKAHLQEGGTIQSIPEKLKINIELATKLVALIHVGD